MTSRQAGRRMAAIAAQRRRRPLRRGGGKRTGAPGRRGEPLRPKERRELIQLEVCGGIFVLLVAWHTILQPLINSLNFRLQECGVHINFGMARSLGSLTYSILMAILGTVVENHGTQVLPLTGEVHVKAVAGDRIDEAMFRHVDTPNPAYKLNRASSNSANWV